MKSVQLHAPAAFLSKNVSPAGFLIKVWQDNRRIPCVYGESNPDRPTRIHGTINHQQFYVKLLTAIHATFEKLIDAQLVKILSAIYETQSFIAVFTGASQRSLSWAQINVIHTYTFKIHFNIILSTTPRYFPSVFPPKLFPKRGSRAFHPHFVIAIISVTVQIIKLLITQFSPTSTCSHTASLYRSTTLEFLFW